MSSTVVKIYKREDCYTTYESYDKKIVTNVEKLKTGKYISSSNGKFVSTKLSRSRESISKLNSELSKITG